MTKLFSAFSFFAGLLILAMAYFNAPGTSTVNARESAPLCRMMEVALDEGYGVTRVEMREICRR